MEIKLKDIPEYLKNSELFRIFKDSSDDNDITIIDPTHNNKEIIIESFSDLILYLDIFRYWMMDEFPNKLFYDFVLKNRNNDIIDIPYLKDKFFDLEIITDFEQIKNFNEKSCIVATQQGNLGLLTFLYENGCSWNINAICAAAKYNYLDCLKYLHRNHCPWSVDMCKVAAMY